MTRARTLLLIALLALPACPDNQPALPPDNGPALEVGRPPPDSGPTIPPLAPLREPQPLPIAGWMAAGVAPGVSTASLDSALEQGAFALPAKGKAYGVDWGPLTPAADGEITPLLPPGWTLYAAATVEAPAKTRVFGRFDVIYDVRTLNGSSSTLQPGDIYGSGRVRVPTLSASGSQLLVVQGYARGTVRPRVQLWSTEDELVFNLQDATLPDLVVGDSAEGWIGVAVLNLTDRPALDVVARVEGDARFTTTEVRYPSLPASAVTMVAFRLAPKAPIAAAPAKLQIGLRLESTSLAWSYRREITLETVPAGSTFRRTYRSPMDGSVQVYAVVPPASFDAAKDYALVLSLHGAGVESIGQAKAYSPKPWAYIIAPTNRRPFGFDWEEFGRVNALEVLDHATAAYRIAPSRVYLTGHSMGGHGTYHLGVHFPGRFAAIAPSAGWGSFESYQGAPRPTGAIGRARAASNTADYLGNLAHRGAYVLQGADDDNVPPSEAQMMVAALKKVTSDVVYFEQPGVGHWWDGDAAPGVDCVDWPPLFDFLKAHTLDPTELEFTFTSVSPWVSPRRSFVTILSESDAAKDCVVQSSVSGDTVTLTTTNVRGLSIDGAALKAKSIAKIVVDGNELAVPGGVLTVGPQGGKRPDQHGPLNQAFQRPFCFVYPDQAVVYERYAAHLVSTWAVNGNGLACALPLSRLRPETRAAYNLIYLGVARAQAQPPAGISWDAAAITVGAKTYPAAALAAVFPEGDRLSAAFAATSGAEHLLFRYHPFSSRSGLPDYFVWAETGSLTSGFFSPDWTLAP